MPDIAPPTRDDETLLGVLAALDLALARRLYTKSKAAADDGEINSLSRTYLRLARSLRRSR